MIPTRAYDIASAAKSCVSTRRLTANTRWKDVDRMRRPGDEARNELHQRAVQDILQARFQFPTPENPSLRAFTNVPEVTMPVQLDTGDELLPDIVVTEAGGNTVKLHVDVETADTVNEEVARERWLPCSQLSDSAFYLYVPVGCGARAKRICRRLRLPVYGFRTWRYTPQGLETNDISERPGVIKSLLPPIIRRLFE